MLKKILSMTLGSCLMVVLLGMTASCSDADFVKPDQVDARVDARWDKLSKSLTEKLVASELAVAHLSSMLDNLQQEQDAINTKLQDMLQNFATNDYAEYLAEQARLSAIEAAKAMIAVAIANLSGTGEYQDLSGILNDIEKLKEADKDLSARLLYVEAYISQVEAMLDDYYTKAEVDALLSSIRSETDAQFAKVESGIWALYNNLSEYCKLVDLKDAFQVLTDSITSIDERLKEAIAETAILEAELKADSVRLASLEGTTEALSQRLGQLEISNDSLCTEVGNNLMRIVQLRNDLETEMGMLRAEMEDNYAKNIGRIEELRAFVEELRDEMYLLFSDLNRWMNTLVTSVVYQGQIYDYVYARVIGSDWFPYWGAINADYLEGGSYNIQEKAGYIYATVNPSDIDATNLRMALENSLAKKSYYLTPVPEEAIPAADLRLTRASSPNGLWKIPVRSIAHTSFDPFNDADETDMLLALKVTCWGGEKSVYSQYAATWEGPKPAVAATSAQLTADGSNYASLKTSDGVRFSSKQSLNDSTLYGGLLLWSGGKRVYRKYVECVQVRDINKRDITDSLRSIINGQNKDFQQMLRTQDDGSADDVRMICPDSLMNNYCTLRYYLWNYDGTILSNDLEVIFSDDETL